MGVTSGRAPFAEYYWAPTAAGSQFTVPDGRLVSTVMVDPQSILVLTDPLADGTKYGQVLIIIGQDDVNVATLNSGGNLLLSEPIVLARGDAVALTWSYFFDLSGKWIEFGRSVL